MAKNYQMFRIEFLAFWVVANVGYCIGLNHLAIGKKSNVMNDGSYGVLEYFAMYLAFVVVFRFFFAACHIVSMKFKYSVKKSIYGIEEVNLKKLYKEQRGIDEGSISVVDYDPVYAMNKSSQENESVEKSPTKVRGRKEPKHLKKQKSRL